MDKPIVFYQQKFNLHKATLLPIMHKEAMVAIVYNIHTHRFSSSNLGSFERLPMKALIAFVAFSTSSKGNL